MIEIERKFLVTAFPEGEFDGSPVQQGYLTAATDSVELRLRQYGADYFLTLKSEGGLSRAEYEIPLDEAQFTILWPMTEGRRVEKTRYTGKLADGYMFQLDVFSGRLAPLMLVEVEFKSEEMARAFVPPSWFGTEVTEDKRYRNKTLALSKPSTR
ncbi:CYTH domain-containing protein [Brucellaceae bacterium D45D]